ncbi:uncharacterized protein EURHEDRAFT_465651 [Aspergillus ruber CBS 135680]|uniref:Uncharacterized protein n=1 Tax=Aspergillus ruber (strain CBS 135680) TaxID=1388766 RepID=A0A017S2E0_ASPRC|nr:uncharacterized protein EURHEDRAFT_465651 [Aspergillus ruber CBS 135680]EYE91082.1 hypothetical protein EURHEDRAFT_465651 [Aspergillus ruber CBS 135680]
MDPLVSPAKARQAAIQAKDWAYVNSWLSRQYAPKPVPSFERNEDTLRTLLALAAANDVADEEATLIHRAREEAVQGFKVREEAEDKHKSELLDEVEMCLDDKGRQNLDDLAETTVVLGALSTETTDLGQSVIELTKEEFDTREQISKVGALQKYLEKELVALQEQLETLNSDETHDTSSELPALTAEWTKNTKLLTAKVGEYRDKIASLERNKHKGVTIEGLIAEERDVLQIKETVETLENRVRMFLDLSGDIPSARAQYRQIEHELEQLIQQRDSMLEQRE